jgi:hypothetical protein
MAYRDELLAARIHAERLEEENRMLRARVGEGAGPARSRVGASIAMLFWTLSALSASLLGLVAGPEEPDAPSAGDVTTIGDVVTPAPGTDWGDVRTTAVSAR